MASQIESEIIVHVNEKSGRYIPNRWKCKHGQIYRYNWEDEKWTVIKFFNNWGKLGCDCKTPCSPDTHEEAIEVLYENSDVYNKIGICPDCRGFEYDLVKVFENDKVTIQCLNCGNPRIVDPIEIDNRVKFEKEKPNKLDYQITLAKSSISQTVFRLKEITTNIEYYKQNKERLIEEARLACKKELENKMAYLKTKLHDTYITLKKQKEVINIGRGKQSKLF